MKIRIPSLLPLVLLAASAAVALALTLGELTQTAAVLEADYAAHVADLEACLATGCNEVAQLHAENAALEARRSQLHADRATFDPCSTCSTVDGLIADIDASAMRGGTLLDEIDEQD